MAEQGVNFNPAFWTSSDMCDGGRVEGGEGPRYEKSSF